MPVSSGTSYKCTSLQGLNLYMREVVSGHRIYVTVAHHGAAPTQNAG